MNKHPDADVMINFASLRSAYDATVEAMTYPQVHIHMIIYFFKDNDNYLLDNRKSHAHCIVGVLEKIQRTVNKC